MLSFTTDVADCVDKIIAQEASEKRVSLFEEFINGTAWILNFRDLCKTYASLAEPDALRLAPELARYFDHKAEEITMSYSYNIELRDRLLLTLSQRRKELGFDVRGRNGKPKKTYKKLDRGE